MNAEEFGQYKSLIDATTAENNQWSAEQAQKQMDFQERMSNTAHQREMKDLEAAGLNPILATHSSGASTPSGAMAETDRGNTTALFGLLEKMIDSDNAKANAELSAQQRASGTVGSAITSPDISGRDIRNIGSIAGLRISWNMANSAAAIINAVGNMNPSRVGSALDSASVRVASALGNKTPSPGTSAYRAMQYRQRTGNSSTTRGLEWIRGVVNSIRSKIQ